MARSFDVVTVEAKWQARWLDEGTYEVDNDDPREHYYALCMYPYPSGAAHQGHIRTYTFGDLVVRYQTMLGKAVLTPFGFDSFGLPAENAAIKAGSHPRLYSEARMKELKSSVRRLGAVYDWRREVYSHDPVFMKYSQMIFLAFFKAGLAYRAEAPVNWCPGCATVLANEQVLADGTIRGPGGAQELRAVVLQDHRLRRGAPQRRRRPRVAREGQDHAAQLDRPFRGSGVRPSLRCSILQGAARLHDPSRHRLRRHLRRRRARASPARGTHDGRRARERQRVGRARHVAERARANRT